MKLLEITNEDPGEGTAPILFINCDYIIAIEAITNPTEGMGRTVLTMASGVDQLRVVESIEEIIEQLSGLYGETVVTPEPEADPYPDEPVVI